MEVMDLPEMGRREELVPDIGRHSQDLRGVRRAMTRTLPKLNRWPVFHALAELRCVIGVMQNIDDIVNNAQLTARDFIVQTRIEDRSIRAAGAPARLHPDSWQLHRPAPRLNAHRNEVAKEVDQASRASPGASADANRLQNRDVDPGPLSGVRVLSFSQAWSGCVRV